MTTPACPLCSPLSETVLWRNDTFRVILVDDASYAGYCRVVLNRHVREMTDLTPAERNHIMQAVFAVEQVLRDLMQPDKINLASLGNQPCHQIVPLLAAPLCHRRYECAYIGHLPFDASRVSRSAKGAMLQEITANL